MLNQQQEEHCQLFMPIQMIREVGLSAEMVEEPGVCHNQDTQQVIDLQDKLLEDSYGDESNEEEFYLKYALG